METAKPINIAIDGPAGAGKSTLARLLAARFGFVYVDTGALYRSIGLFALRKGVEPSDAAGVRALLPEIRVELKFKGGKQHVLLCGEDVSARIRTPEVSDAASRVSAIPAVRTFLLGLQRDIAARSNVVMDGRDIGTVVLPGALVKIFLSASPEDRARRRYEEMLAKGQPAVYERVLADMVERDRADSGRDVAPLKPAPDAVRVDTTGFPLEKSLATLAALVKERLT